MIGNRQIKRLLNDKFSPYQEQYIEPQYVEKRPQRTQLRLSRSFHDGFPTEPLPDLRNTV